MTPGELHDRAVDNLKGTYIALAAAAGGQVVESDGLSAMVGAFPHPICNFAVVRAESGCSPVALRRLATEHAGFHVYVCHAQDEPVREIRLSDSGFRRVHTLVEMASTSEEAPPPLDVVAAGESHERRLVAGFMMAQFFTRQPDWVRERISDATARATGLDLLSVRAGQALSASVMLRRCERSVGLYNLCVALPQRRRGIGSSLVKWVQSEASARLTPVILQCASDLVPWYSSLGFQVVGTMDVFTLKLPA